MCRQDPVDVDGDPRMIDFELTEEQKALIDTARRFAKERIIPVAAECDRKSEFPRDVFKAASRRA